MEDQKLLLEKLADQEKEIQELYRQQRDVRFLMKRLHVELGLRLHKRANPAKKSKRLVYGDDPQIKTALNAKEQSPSELLKFAHHRDAQNITTKRQVLKSYVKAIKWKIIARIFDILTKILKKGIALQ
ncbi:MAG TPA: hypothetical protein VMR95_03905 [Candidatus Binatia bacterium]|jgi:hypothetical protein|nr:hypothetical protein [Candidatus Binatia bacterium]